MIGRTVRRHGRVGCLSVVLVFLAWSLGVAAPAQAGWHAPLSISGVGNLGRTTLAVDPRGDAIAVWYSQTYNEGFSATYVVKAAFKPAGGSWRRPVSVGS